MTGTFLTKYYLNAVKCQECSFYCFWVIKEKPTGVILFPPSRLGLNTDFTLSNCLAGSVKLTKNADPDKYKYSGYDIRFDSRSGLSLTDGSMGRNVIIFGSDVSSSGHINNKGKDIVILRERATQELNDITLTTEAKYSINFTQSERGFVLCLHYKIQK